jgi:hypothetical protein
MIGEIPEIYVNPNHRKVKIRDRGERGTDTAIAMAYMMDLIDGEKK